MVWLMSAAVKDTQHDNETVADVIPRQSVLVGTARVGGSRGNYYQIVALCGSAMRAAPADSRI